MSHSVSLSDLHNMSREDRERELNEIITRAQAPRNGQRAIIAAKIRAFENRYDMTTAELVERLEGGQLRETADFSRWMFWFNTLTDARE
jgi:hypothetical protein